MYDKWSKVKMAVGSISLGEFTAAYHRFISFSDVQKAYQRIGQYIHKTPVLTSSQADAKAGRKLHFKGENFQKSGSFKARGALNAILKAKERNPSIKGIITHSSGNHGQAIAWAAQQVQLPCCVVVPEMAADVKKSAIVNYGASLVECGPAPIDRDNTCERLQKENQFEFIPPYDHLDVMAGQGTVALELLEQVPDLDAILVSISGGGLSAGIAIASKSIRANVKVFLVTPMGKLMEQCLKSGVRPWGEPPQYLDTIADGIRLQRTGYLTTPVLMDLAEKEVFEMTDEEMVQGMKFCFERMKIVIEAAAGAAVSAAFSNKLKDLDPGMKNIGVILCGGNENIEQLPW